MKKWHKHYGVYGVALEGKKILVIKKTRGPYINRYDLPGGSLREDESIVKHLKREFIEETGYEIEVIEQLGVQDFKIEEGYLEYEIIHHIGIFYRVSLVKKIREVSQVLDVYGVREENDSNGIEFKETEGLNIKNSSPIVTQGISYIKNKVKNLGIVEYKKWRRLE